MSDGDLVVALVCEGQTDVPILRALLETVLGESIDVRCLQPELDETQRSKGRAGWTEVRAWCERNGSALDELFEPDLGDPIDILVVVMDVDVAVEAGIENPPVSGVGPYESSRLRSLIAGWLTGSDRRVQICTPVMAIEAWIIAAMFPREKKPEKISDPAGYLARRGKLKESALDGKVWKDLRIYRDEFARVVKANPKRVQRACPEADRFLKAVAPLG